MSTITQLMNQVRGETLSKSLELQRNEYFILSLNETKVTQRAIGDDTITDSEGGGQSIGFGYLSQIFETYINGYITFSYLGAYFPSDVIERAFTCVKLILGERQFRQKTGKFVSFTWNYIIEKFLTFECLF